MISGRETNFLNKYGDRYGPFLVFPADKVKS